MPLRARLWRHEVHADNRLGGGPHLVDRATEFHAAALAATSGVNLRLDDPEFAAQFLGGGDRLSRRRCDSTAQHGNPVRGEDFLCLILVNLHHLAPLQGWRTSTDRSRCSSCPLKQGRTRGRMTFSGGQQEAGSRPSLRPSAELARRWRGRRPAEAVRNSARHRDPDLPVQRGLHSGNGHGMKGGL